MKVPASLWAAVVALWALAPLPSFAKVRTWAVLSGAHTEPLKFLTKHGYQPQTGYQPIPFVSGPYTDKGAGSLHVIVELTSWGGAKQGVPPGMTLHAFDPAGIPPENRAVHFALRALKDGSDKKLPFFLRSGGLNVLDIGGSVFMNAAPAAIAKNQVVAVEKDLPTVLLGASDYLQKVPLAGRGRLTIHLGDLLDVLPTLHRRFDVATLDRVLHYLPTKADVLRALELVHQRIVSDGQISGTVSHDSSSSPDALSRSDLEAIFGRKAMYFPVEDGNAEFEVLGRW